MQLSMEFTRPYRGQTLFSGVTRRLREALARRMADDSGWRDDAGQAVHLRVPARVWHRHGALLADIARDNQR